MNVHKNARLTVHSRGTMRICGGASCGEGLIGSGHVVVGESRIPSLGQGARAVVNAEIAALPKSIISNNASFRCRRKTLTRQRPSVIDFA